MDRAIVHMDLDSFFVSCERLVDSRLNGIPLIIGGNSERSVVSSCSYEARKFGVRSAMPVKAALRLCPQATVVNVNMELYSKLSKSVTQIIAERAPLFEKASIDEFYLDITGMDKFFGNYKWTNELTELITKETGLPISFGLSVNKTVAKIATGEGKPNGKMHIEQQQVRTFLNPLSIRKIPFLGKASFEALTGIGIHTIRDLAQTPVEHVQSLLGKNGVDLWNKANGICNSPVEPYSERKSISTERTFEQDTYDVNQIKVLIGRMVEKLGFQLRQGNWLASCVVVKIRYSNFETETKQQKIYYTSNDRVIIDMARELFEKLYTKGLPIRLVGIGLTGLVKGNYQINLFEDSAEQTNLYQAIDAIKKRFGQNAIKRGGG